MAQLLLHLKIDLRQGFCPARGSQKGGSYPKAARPMRLLDDFSFDRSLRSEKRHAVPRQGENAAVARRPRLRMFAKLLKKVEIVPGCRRLRYQSRQSRRRPHSAPNALPVRPAARRPPDPNHRPAPTVADARGCTLPLSAAHRLERSCRSSSGAGISLQSGQGGDLHTEDPRGGSKIAQLARIRTGDKQRLAEQTVVQCAAPTSCAWPL